MNKRNTDLAVVGAGAALYALGSLVTTKEPQRANSAAAFAVIGGLGLATYGAYRVKPLFGLGVGAALFTSGYVSDRRRKQGLKQLPIPGLSFSMNLKHGDLDSGLDNDTRDAVRAAMKQERDPVTLHAFAARLSAAGYTIASDLLARRASELAPQALVGQDAHLVSEAQRMLRDLGYAVDATGALDAQTQKAIKNFQSLHDLDIDGMLTPQTIARLRASTKP